MTITPCDSCRVWSRPATSIILALLLASALAVEPAAAQGGTAAGLRAGTSGLGFDVVKRISDRSHARLAAGTVSFTDTISTSDLDYDADARVATAFLLLDWYPAAGAFRVSAGAGWNGSEVEVTAPLESLLSLDPDELALFPSLGSAVGTARGDELVPVLLLGWGNPLRGGPWSLSFEVGAFYQGEPEVELSARTDVPVIQVPGGLEALNRLIEDEERELERELEDYTVIPIVSWSLTYRF